MCDSGNLLSGRVILVVDLIDAARHFGLEGFFIIQLLTDLFYSPLIIKMMHCYISNCQTGYGTVQKLHWDI